MRDYANSENRQIIDAQLENTAGLDEFANILRTPGIDIEIGMRERGRLDSA